VIEASNSGRSFGGSRLGASAVDRIGVPGAAGWPGREIRAFLAEQYGTEVSPEFISSVTDEVMAEVTAWQARPLEALYPLVFFEALRVKIREDGVVRNKAV
jgi:putative transposase